jgi:prepilin-type N-terminal cleavage/methylation domain-containing protein
VSGPAVIERFLKGERGFSLPEMLVTTVIMIVVFFALHSIFDMSVKVFTFGNSKVEAVESARAAMEKMEREIRQAPPYDRNASPADTHVFDTWTPTAIRFGNDLDGNGAIVCNTTGPPCEKIGYQRNGTTLERDNSSTGANFQPVADNVQSLAFTYYDSNGNVVNSGGTEANVDRVMVRMVVTVNRSVGNPATQTLTTVIDLRNR